MKNKSLYPLYLCLGVSVVLVGGCGGGSSSSGGNSGGNNGGSGTDTVPTPTVSSINPTSVNAGAAATTLTVTGTGYIASTTIQIGGAAEATTYVSSTQVTAVIPATQLVNGAQLSVVAVNGTLSSGSGTNLQVMNPAPTITSISPTAALAGATSPNVTVIGTGFVPTTVIQVNGNSRTTTYVSTTQVNVVLTASDVANGGSLSLTAVNGSPGGGTSTGATFSVSNPAPILNSISPASVAPSAASPTVTLNGANFVPGSVVHINSGTVASTFLSPSQITFSAAGLTAPQVAIVAVVNPSPGGGTSVSKNLGVLSATPTPVITQVSPAQFSAGSGATTITVAGTGFAQLVLPNTYFITASVLWNGTPLTNSSVNVVGTPQTITAQVPANLITSLGTASISVSSTTSTPATSNTISVNIVPPPPPTLTSIYPNGGPNNSATTITLTGTGFTPNSTVAINGTTIPSSYTGSTQMSATIPATGVQIPGNLNVTVTSPPPSGGTGGGTSGPQVFTSFISIANNDIVYNAVDGLLYASVPASTVGAIGNAVVGIDPYTGTIKRQIQVGTQPNKLALSTDGTQLFVGIDGAGAVAQINLAQGTIVNQFSLGGGPGLYNPPYTASYMAAVPGFPNSVAVATTGQYSNGSSVAIFDSGVRRSAGLTNIGQGPLSFDASGSTLYVASGYIYALTVGPTGITGSTQFASVSNPSWIQYDNGSLYVSTGQVFNASTGALNGTFYTAATSPATGPIVSDSTLGRAFVGLANFSNSGAVSIFDELSFNLIGSVPVNALGTSGYSTNFRKIVRWGQNGLAIAAVPSAFTSKNQIYIFQSPLVKDVSNSPADLSISLTAPATATTGTAINYVATIKNNGPNTSVGTTVSVSLDSSLIINSITPSQGSCITAAAFSCDLGGIANGTSVTVTVNATPTSSGTLAASALTSSSSFDSTASNNQATASTTVTGAYYSAVPVVSSLSPNIVLAGSGDFTLTVNGSGFNVTSAVNLGATALTTTYVSSTQLTALVPASTIANYGWAPITVSNPSPGGGASSILPLTIYGTVNVPASSILFDPYGQSIYATIPGSATGITGNSVVAINPFTGTIGTPIPIGSQPTVMAESGDGNDLYVSLTGANSVAQFDLVHQQFLQTITFSGQPTGYSTTGATFLSVMPGVDTTLAVSFSGTDGIMDITGNVGKFRPNFGGSSFPTFGDATHLYTYDTYSSGAQFYRYSINSNGLTLIDGTTLKGLGGFSGGFQSGNGLIYGQGGGIINPLTTPPSQIQTLPLVDFYGSGSLGGGVGVAADPSLQKDFLLLENFAGTSAYGLVRYDLNTFLPESFLPMPAGVSGIGASLSMLRFGQDGIALLSNNSSGLSTPVVQLILLRGPFIAPQELFTSFAATLTSSSTSSFTHGSGNAILTLTGTNFLPGVAVTWNGSYRSTTVVDPQHVTVAIPASDVANTGSASLVATNPGAAASNALTVTIN
jgi:trimeric autotransporter adhesin